MIEYIEDKRALDINGVLYKDSIINYRKLKAHNIIQKGPIYRYYEYPGIYKPMPHQKSTCDFMTLHDRGFVFNAIGTGKTLIAYWYFDYLLSQKLVNKCLVIAPLSTLEYTHTETLKWNFSHLKYIILHGSKEKRLLNLSKDKDVYIINFDGLLAKWRYNNKKHAWEVSNSGMLEALSKRKDIDCIFIDEVATLRNKETNAWRNINYLYGPHTQTKLWGFTGSPVPKDPTDAYAQSLLVNPAALPQRVDMRNHKQTQISYTQFKHNTMVKDPYSEYKWHRKENWEQTAYEALQPSVRFTRKQVEPSLPGKIIQTRKLALTEVQKRAYNKIIKESRVEFETGTVTAVHEGARIMKLVQICCGAVYDDIKEVHELSCTHKLNELIAIKEQLDDHLLVAVPFVSVAKYLTKKLEKLYNVEYITKDISMKQRSKYFHCFNKQNLEILIATPSSIPHGINLQNKCHTTVWWGPINRYDIYEQFNGRNDRKGQTKKVLLVHLTSSPIEDKMYERLKNKESAQGTLLELLGLKNAV